MNEQLPYQVTEAAKAYEALAQLPVSVLLDNLRSTYNVGSFFRTGDAAGVQKLYLSGITSAPPHKGISKTASGRGRNRTVGDERKTPPRCSPRCAPENHEIAAIETSIHAVDLFDWTPSFPVCLLFGNEKEGFERRTGRASRPAHPHPHAGNETFPKRCYRGRHCDLRVVAEIPQACFKARASALFLNCTRRAVPRSSSTIAPCSRRTSATPAKPAGTCA